MEGKIRNVKCKGREGKKEQVEEREISEKERRIRNKRKEQKK